MNHDGHHLALLKADLAALRRRKSQLLQDLGERALEILTGEGSLDAQDPKTRILIKDVQKVQRELHLLEDRLKALEAPRPSQPPVPGTDPRFPFSR